MSSIQNTCHRESEAAMNAYLSWVKYKEPQIEFRIELGTIQTVVYT